MKILYNWHQQLWHLWALLMMVIELFSQIAGCKVSSLFGCHGHRVLDFGGLCLTSSFPLSCSSIIHTDLCVLERWWEVPLHSPHRQEDGSHHSKLKKIAISLCHYNQRGGRNSSFNASSSFFKICSRKLRCHFRGLHGVWCQNFTSHGEQWRVNWWLDHFLPWNGPPWARIVFEASKTQG